MAEKRNDDRKLVERRAGDEPRAVAELRRRAMDRYAELGVPTSRNEDWKHTPVAKILETDREVADLPAPAEAPAEAPRLSENAIRAVFVNGRLVEDGSLADLPAGVRIGSLARALREADGVPAWLGKCAEFETRSLTALNTACMTDGALVEIARGADVDRPIHLVYLTTEEADGAAVHIRNLVVAGTGSRAEVVEHWIGGEADVLVNVVTEIAVEDDAEVRHVKLQEEGPETDHLSSVDAVVSRDGRFHHHSVATGGRIGRTEARVKLAGEGAFCDLSGVYLGRRDQVQDQLTLVEHAVPHGTSRQVYKGVLDEKARGIFNGLVLVREDAQKTDAVQSNKNLVLAETADAHARPQLDISADDVKCAHGATVGALDESSLFYLRSRGIGPAEARRLLIHAFAGDVLETMPEGAARDRAERIVSEWLEG